MSKQDRQGARTVSELARRYNFDKSFAEVLGIATDAQDTALKAAEAVAKFDPNLTADEIFDLLTNGGTEQGIYREGDKIYLNANFIKTGFISSDLIKAGVIRSLDYEVVEVDAYYPSDTLYPAVRLYPNDGKNITKGMEIDFGAGVIRIGGNDADYAEQEYVDEAIANLTEQARKASPHNILDNSDFSHPVNQRGQTEYYGTTGYTIDRWRATSVLRVTVNDGYVSIKNESTGYYSLTQYFDPNIFQFKQGEVYTAACKLHDGTILCGSVAITASEYDRAFRMDSGTTARFYGSTNRFILMFAPGDAVDFEWVAIYKGEYTADTLPEYHPKGYGAELAECQRYFRVVQNGNGYAGNNAYIFFPFEFRVVPTATVVSLGTIRTDGSSVTPTGVTAVNQYQGSVRLTMSGTYPSSNQPANLYNANIQLSADL
jgi:hypothetical protein